MACSEEPTPQTTEKNQYLKGYTEEIIEVETPNNVEIESNVSEQSPETSNKYAYEVIYTDSIGWGYQILQDGSVIIKQTYIPAIQGNHAFRTEEDAQKTAEFILEKMNNNIFPPTLSKEELTYLNVLP